MAKIEPGSASDDVRVFDDIDDGEGEEGSRLPLLIVIALLVLAAFGGVVWLAYNQGVQRGRTEAPRPLLADSTGPRAPNTALKVYEQPAPPDQDAADADGVPPQPTETTKPAPPVVTTQTAPPPAVTAQATPVPTPKPMVTEPTPMATKPPQQLAAPKPKPIPPEDTLVATPPPAAATAGGAYVLQIGAYKSQAEADAAWKAYQSKHPMLGGYESDVKQVDLADKGTWYRLRVGAFPTKDAANATCAKLKADGGDCLLAKK